MPDIQGALNSIKSLFTGVTRRASKPSELQQRTLQVLNQALPKAKPAALVRQFSARSLSALKGGAQLLAAEVRSLALARPVRFSQQLQKALLQGPDARQKFGASLQSRTDLKLLLEHCDTQSSPLSPELLDILDAVAQHLPDSACLQQQSGRLIDHLALNSRTQAVEMLAQRRISGSTKLRDRALSHFVLQNGRYGLAQRNALVEGARGDTMARIFKNGLRSALGAATRLSPQTTKTIVKLRQNLTRETQKWPVSHAQFVKSVTALKKPGDFALFGVSVHPEGSTSNHALQVGVRKEQDGTFSVFVVNTGSGIETEHGRFKNGSYKTVIGSTGLSLNQVKSTALFRSSSPAAPPMGRFYQEFKRWGGTPLQVEPWQAPPPQDFGTCAASCLSGALHYLVASQPGASATTVVEIKAVQNMIRKHVVRNQGKQGGRSGVIDQLSRLAAQRSGLELQIFRTSASAEDTHELLKQWGDDQRFPLERLKEESPNMRANILKQRALRQVRITKPGARTGLVDRLAKLEELEFSLLCSGVLPALKKASSPDEYSNLAKDLDAIYRNDIEAFSALVREVPAEQQSQLQEALKYAPHDLAEYLR